MNASYEWLREFCPTDLSPRAVADLLTARCATVEEVTPLRGDLADIVVARVVEAGRHPNSDHLWVTKVDAGEGALLDVVCGAPRVSVGTLYPFARVGVTLPGGIRIERRKIRGEVSNGMLCSARELGLGTDHDGILALDIEAAPGTPLLAALPVGDTRLVVDVLPNRPDLLSHVGLAREIAAATGQALTLPPIRSAAGVAGASASVDGSHVRRPGTVDIDVRVIDPTDAPRYMGVVIRGVSVGPSPAWLAARIEAAGARAINNVVDATNYMLLGFGQPMHAFDLGKLAGPAIVVRRATAGERIVTLDGVERALDPDTTVIADAERPHAIAGIMGGRDSEVDESTRDVFLEVAVFDPRRVRASRRRLGLSTDASYRFERGVDRNGVAAALEFATRLISAVAGGEVVGAVADIGGPAPERPPIPLRAERVARLLGVALPVQVLASLLRSVGCTVVGEVADDQRPLLIVPPSWRADLVAEADLIEEIARTNGYDAIPDDLRPFRPTAVPDAPLWGAAARLRSALNAAGLYETRPMPFVSGSDATHSRVANPLAENEAHLRRSVLETLSGRVEYNFAHMQRNVRLYEIGSVFSPGPTAMPAEEARVGVVLAGDRRPAHFSEPRPPEFDEWDAKWVAERIAAVAFPGAAVMLEPAPPDGARADAGTADAQPLWSVQVDGRPRGVVARLRLDAPVWAPAVFAGELSLGRVYADAIAPPGESAHAPPVDVNATGTEHRRFTSLPTTPAAEFDLALLVPDQTPAADVERLIRRAGGELLESVSVFDEFRGEGIPAGHRSLAWHLTLRDPVRTLRDKEVEGRRQRILRTLESELGVRPRGA